VAYEAADSGLLSPELAAGIRRVKGVRRIGVRLGNWLTADQGRSLLLKSQGDNLRSKRNYAILALLIGCGLRRGELLALWVASIQLREEHWVIADLYGKAGHIRTVPIPLWVVKALRRVFRGKFIDGLKRLYRRKKLGRAGPAALFNEPKQFAKLLGRLRRQDWVVYAKAFGGSLQVLRYLGRYTHRIAISNHRLLAFDGERVTFRWRDYAHGNKSRVMTLHAIEFLRRFFLHVLPKGFVRIRHFGFLANRFRTDRLALCRQLLASIASGSGVYEDFRQSNHARVNFHDATTLSVMLRPPFPGPTDASKESASRDVRRQQPSVDAPRTQSGTSTVRICPPLPIRSTIAQRSSHRCSRCMRR
jgi:hypothetical protein